jgi:hypothetical protein
MPRLNKKIAFKVNTWANELGCDPNSIVRRLAKAEIPYKSGDLVTGRDLVMAFTGDKEAAMVAKLNAETGRIKREEQVAQGELVTIAQAEDEIWNKLLMPLKQDFELMPEKVASLANPDKPQVAQAALRNWVEETKRGIKGRK